jgi:hypothetical protein
MNRLERIGRFGIVLLAVASVSGCASTQVTSQQSNIGNEKLARPDHIYVYDFAATPADLSPEDASTAQYSMPSTPQSADAIATGRKLGNLVAKNLVTKIQAMGLPAAEATAGTKPETGDIVIRGHFESVEEGSAGKRIVLGFGSGNAQLLRAQRQAGNGNVRGSREMQREAAPTAADVEHPLARTE